MTRILEIAAGALALAALSACDDMETASGTGSSGIMSPSPSGPPFITTYDASVSDAAVDACRSTLEAQTDGNVDVVGSEFSEANTAIYMRVGENGAPWRCLVSNDGTGPSVMFMGDEGAL
ncbi:hypothetical protein OCH239_16965 [Roseivivax halodurans JCM 10272]|uniref:Lipoprotein n=1 Tax=Roseivivax halodurans JCM 10272 TaxID=1449350 RepID=X7ECI0_9RHOB|nr:hypothetical protein [Roseivivax halodurans]ETX12823.1 hypothetical protein OCH239_16965 [Roseivivax halodurans JCM 10272]